MDASVSVADSRGFVDGAACAVDAAAPHVLVVGAAAVADYLKDNRFRVTSVADETAIDAILHATVIDVVVLALAPERGELARLVQRLRDESPVPLIVLASRRDEFDRVMALELGADDCLAYPFGLRELLARVRAVLRRRRIDLHAPKTEGPRAYRFGGFELNLNTRRLASPARRTAALTRGEFSVLVALLAAGGRTLSRTQILEVSRRHEDEVYDRAVDMLVMRLRRKLEADTVVTVRGAGYRIGVTVEPVY